MSLGGKRKRKTEHVGAKNGGGHWGTRAEAKQLSKKVRRLRDKAEIRKEYDFSKSKKTPYSKLLVQKKRNSRATNGSTPQDSYSAETVALYDEIYTRLKNYPEEAEKVQKWIAKLRPNAKSILDIACGTAEHAKYLKAHFEIDGLDISKNFVAFAQKKNPDCRYYQADMTDFHLDRRYDVVMSLFSSIGYVLTKRNLSNAIRAFASHLTENGIILIEPWFTPDVWQTGNTHMAIVDEPQLKVARVNVSEKRNAHSYFKWHYLVGTPKGVRHFTEEHTLALFSIADMKEAFEANGLQVHYDAEGIFGRGLYIAERKKPE